MEMIKQRRTVTTTSFDLVFLSADGSGHGYSFPCTEQGEVFPIPEVAAENYRKCVTGEHNVHTPEVRKSEISYVQAAVGKCQCRRRVALHGFTNTCDCGREYNMVGQQLAPRSQWGEETGEHIADILRI